MMGEAKRRKEIADILTENVGCTKPLRGSEVSI
jgi:hypothetical protein